MKAAHDRVNLADARHLDGASDRIDDATMAAGSYNNQTLALHIEAGCLLMLKVVRYHC